MTSASTFVFACLLCIFILLFAIRLWLKFNRWKRKRNFRNITFGFFHPYCNAGGGGERVLWAAIRSIQLRYIEAHCVVYTGDLNVTREEMLVKVESRFNIKLSREIEIIYLKKRALVEAKFYPYFTLLGQSLGSIILGAEALMKYVPDVYIDTMGYAFTLPLFKYLGSCRVGAYVHYPTISTDMLDAVSHRKLAVNNRKFISNNIVLTSFKFIYYKIFALLYGFVGQQAEIIMVNSTWTKSHIDQLWKKAHQTFIVYPPCDISGFKTILRTKNTNMADKCRILSIAQFRPEKNHKLQIQAFDELLKRLNQPQNLKLVLVGSCRDEEDNQRVIELKKISRDLGISKNVEFKINLTFSEIVTEMEAANIALHTMWNEHFGIGVVECMAAGLIMIAHNSGGPKLDIVVDHNGKNTGFLADDIKSFADTLETILKMHPEEISEIRNNARDSVSRFSEDEFEIAFISAIKLFIP